LVSDIKEEEGIPVIEISEFTEDGTPSKRLKTKPSERVIPTHPSLVELGFLEYIEKQRKDGSFQLFPELPAGKDGYFSDQFSKWFSHFVDHAIGDSCEATFFTASGTCFATL